MRNEQLSPALAGVNCLLEDLVELLNTRKKTDNRQGRQAQHTAHSTHHHPTATATTTTAQELATVGEEVGAVTHVDHPLCNTTRRYSRPWLIAGTHGYGYCDQLCVSFVAAH